MKTEKPTRIAEITKKLAEYTVPITFKGFGCPKCKKHSFLVYGIVNELNQEIYKTTGKIVIVKETAEMRCKSCGFDLNIILPSTKTVEQQNDIDTLKAHLNETKIRLDNK